MSNESSSRGRLDLVRDVATTSTDAERKRIFEGKICLNSMISRKKKQPGRMRKRSEKKRGQGGFVKEGGEEKLGEHGTKLATWISSKIARD